MPLMPGLSRGLLQSEGILHFVRGREREREKERGVLIMMIQRQVELY